ncbi:hypothetical protein N7489_009977 [Penicillium chrysogenum]|uniref:Uncharacterized protein n=1 Tax=Penicillium chrysogenum TaxID=5076 RepID=A0ABQ8WV91_PENCH|nr:uncharacterized protein N7489_009977 [Penicillium chrysogenum]KAJ5229269.1 hypothetical protein N7489_009977 [Penicillium chrysogenum]KAJ5258673.1 hypothetical protein N7524_010229 [Penicillium chrysogenum]KAJ5282851.1 hypothetical protein N7505_000831 [Penicillium chrysogenum]KAJ6169145.1 hypothetical protein N7497_001988 [Penicillium chrysogenum]
MGKVKWDAFADQTLLAKIIETHDLALDMNKVASAWPGAEENRPTPRALKERINRIKEIVRTGTAPFAGVSSPSTPKKRGPRKKTNETPTSAGPSRKRKRVAQDGPVHEDEVRVKEEEDPAAELNELLPEVALQTETDLDLDLIDPRLRGQFYEQPADAENGKSGSGAIDPLRHEQIGADLADAEDGKTDPEWTEYNDFETESDLDMVRQ